MRIFRNYSLKNIKTYICIKCNYRHDSINANLNSFEKKKKMRTTCPYCGYVATEHETLDKIKNPTEKDISFCITCGEISQYENNKLVKVDLNLLDKSVKQEINKIRVAWLRTKAISKAKKRKNDK